MKDTISQMELSLTNCKLLVEQLLMLNAQTQLYNEREMNKIKMMQFNLDEIIKWVTDYDRNTESIK